MNTPSRADTRRLNINLARALHRALKQQALAEETTESAIVRRLLVDYLTYTGALAPSGLDHMVQAARQSHEMTTAEVAQVSEQQPVRTGLPTAPPARRS